MPTREVYDEKDNSVTDRVQRCAVHHVIVMIKEILIIEVPCL